MPNPIGTPAVKSSASHDLYISLMNIQPGGNGVGLHLFRNPLVPWLWIGAGIAMVGAAMSLWPSRSRARSEQEAAA
jgi:cytochrome c biogenesis factor